MPVCLRQRKPYWVQRSNGNQIHNPKINMEVSKESLRIKLEFLFRMYSEFPHYIPKDKSRKEVEFWGSLIFSVGFAVIHQTKEDESYSNDTTGYEAAGQAVLAAFEKTQAQINSIFRSVLPATLTLGKKHLIIIEAMDDLTEELKNIYGRAVSEN